MGLLDFIKNLKLREWVVFGFFVISLGMLIAGSVMLAIAIASIPPMPPFDDIPTTTMPPTLQPATVFTTSLAKGVSWSNDLENPSSDAFRTLASNLEKNISMIWTQSSSGNYFKQSLISSPIITQINAFTQAQTGVNFYAEFIFSGSTSVSSVSQTLSAAGYPTDAFASSTAQCSGLIPPTDPSLRTTQNPFAPSSTTPLSQGSFCDASSNLLTNIFLVDVSYPIIGTLDDKLEKISTFLKSTPSLVNLNQVNKWENQEFRLVIYGGNEATPLGRARSFQSWNSIVSLMNSSIVNPTLTDGHQLTDALRFVYNNYRPRQGIAGNIIVLGDGFDFDEVSVANPVANALKYEFNYSLGFILMTTSQAQRQVVRQLATDYFHFYPIDNVDYLNNNAVLETQAVWTCDAFYPTPQPPTPPPTLLPLVTTTGTTTTAQHFTTANPQLPIASCSQNVLFLIDQSQTMILSGYKTAIDFSIKTAQSLAALNSQTTLGFIIYNQIIVAESQSYSDINTFKTSIMNAPQSLGVSDVAIGFGEALKFIKTESSYDSDSVTSILYFVTDGKYSNGTLPQASNSTKTIRSQLQTEVIGINLVETTMSKSNVQQAIQFGVSGYMQSIYVGVDQPDQILSDSLMNSTISQLECKGSNCYTGLTFVIETSEAEGDNLVDVQKKVVMNIMNNYASSISIFKMSVSLIYFSSPDNLVPNESGQSGVLFEHLTDSAEAINLLNSTDFSPLGAASDLQLGFSYTLETLHKSYLETQNLVVFFARGAYEKLSNCCPDPSTEAALVRQLSTVQGVVIGPYSSKNQLDSLTGSNSLDANNILQHYSLNNAENRTSAAKEISDNLMPLIDSFITTRFCPGIPDFISPPCEDPIDVLILLHANDENNWRQILNFTAMQLIPDLLGSTGSFTSRQLTSSTPLNFAIVSYYYLDVITHADFTYLLSPDGYQSLVSSIPFRETRGTATLSTAYKEAIRIFEDGRPYASKNIILITDTMDISDMENAFSEHDAMVQLVGGYTSALTINTNTIPGADYQLNVDSYQLNVHNKYSSRQLANLLSKSTCTYSPKQVMTQPPVQSTPTAPGPIPVVKARNVWPDMTILIDTSTSQNNSMTDVLFEKIRAFLDILLSQYSVGEKGSRFTIATYDGDTVEYSCLFPQINNYYDLSSCRNEDFGFYTRSHQNYSDIAKVLGTIRQQVFENSTAGYRSLNENFLIIFTLGSSSSSANPELSQIQKKGVHTIAIGLSNNTTDTDLSSFAQTAFKVPDWDSPFTGIDTNYNLADQIFQITTKQRTPSTSNFYGNIVFVIDQSLNSLNDHGNVIQFVTDSVQPYLVGPTKTHIGIVPFADNVIDPLSLSSSQQDVNNYLSNWRASYVSSSYAANVGTAIEYVSNIVKSTPDVPTHVIFVVGATNLTGSASSTQLLKDCFLYVANYNSSLETSLFPLVNSTENIFTVSSSADLLNRVTSMNTNKPNRILDLSRKIELNQQNRDMNSFPTSSIAADIVILLDETGISEDEFVIMKNFLTDFTQKFTVGPQSTQFALQSYNGRTIPHDGFHLFESTSNNVVANKIQKLTLAKATENSTDADLAGAIEQELFFFLTESNGWRDDVTTYTIILSHADSFYERDTSTAEGVKNVSTVFAVGLNGQKFAYVKNFTNSNFYETIPTVENLSITAPVITDLLNTLDNDYKSMVYPTQYPVHDIVNADFIMMIDKSLGSGFSPNVRQFLLDFVSNVGTFSQSGNDTKLAVVNYGDSTTTAWSLNDAQDVQSIKNKIGTFEIGTSTGVSNLRKAIDYIILNEADFGVNSNRPTYIIVIAASPTIQPKIDISTSRHLNTRYSTFVIQTNSDNTTFPYTPQVLGTQLVSDRMAINPTLQLASEKMNSFLPWISNEFSAWSITFPDKK